MYTYNYALFIREPYKSKDDPDYVQSIFTFCITSNTKKLITTNWWDDMRFKTTEDIATSCPQISDSIITFEQNIDTE